MFSRRILALSAVALFLGSSTFSQERTKAVPLAPNGNKWTLHPDVTFRKTTKLVQIPVIVSDSHGRPVRGLSKDDFVIFENKVDRKIATFEEVDTRSSAPHVATARPLPPGEYTNIGAQEAPKSILIVLFNGASMDFNTQAIARQQLVKFLKTHDFANQQLCLFAATRSGLKPVHMYTTDPNVLIRALQNVGIVPGPPGGTGAVAAASTSTLDPAAVIQESRAISAMISGTEEDARFSDMYQVSSSQALLNGLKALANYFQRIPGRKSMVVLGGGLPLATWGSGQSSADYSGTYLSALESLVNANIALYPVDPGGIRPNESPQVRSGFEARNPMGQTVFSRSYDRTQVVDFGGSGSVFDTVYWPRSNESMKDVAERTGGKAFYGSNDTSALIQRAIDDSSHFYLLGYYLPEDAKPTRYVLDVKVKRPRLKVRARNRLFVNDPITAGQEDLEAAKVSFLPFTALPLRVKIADTAHESKDINFDVVIEGKDFGLTDQNEMDIDLVATARTANGALAEQVSRTIRGRINSIAEFTSKKLTYSASFHDAKGASLLRFIVRDNVSGRIGSVVVERP